MALTAATHVQEAASEAMRLKGGSWLASLKSALFPIDTWEMPKFFSMSLMMFMIIYIYTTVRDTKDTLVVSTCGAESITFLKVCTHTHACMMIHACMYIRMHARM